MAGAREGESDFLKGFREVYEQGNRAWNDGDFDRAYGQLPANIEYQLSPSWPSARSLRGPGEIIEFFRDLREAFPNLRAEILDIVEVDERTAVTGQRVVGSGASSKVGTAMEIWATWRFEDGRPTRVMEFRDRQAAIESAAAGTGDRA